MSIRRGSSSSLVNDFDLLLGLSSIGSTNTLAWRARNAMSQRSSLSQYAARAVSARARTIEGKNELGGAMQRLLLSRDGIRRGPAMRHTLGGAYGEDDTWLFIP